MGLAYAKAVGRRDLRTGECLRGFRPYRHSTETCLDWRRDQRGSDRRRHHGRRRRLRRSGEGFCSRLSDRRELPSRASHRKTLSQGGSLRLCKRQKERLCKFAHRTELCSSLQKSGAGPSGALVLGRMMGFGSWLPGSPLLLALALWLWLLSGPPPFSQKLVTSVIPPFNYTSHFATARLPFGSRKCQGILLLPSYPSSPPLCLNPKPRIPSLQYPFPSLPDPPPSKKYKTTKQTTHTHTPAFASRRSRFGASGASGGASVLCSGEAVVLVLQFS